MDCRLLPTSALPVSWYQGRSIESSRANAAIVARRCSLLSARELRPMRDSAPVMWGPGRPSRRGSGSAAPFLGPLYAAPVRIPPESRGLLDRAAATRFPALVARSNPAVTRAIALGALALVAAAAVVIVFVRGAAPPAPSETLDPFVAALSRGDDRGAAALTNDPRAAAAALAANRRGLDGARVHVSAQDVAKQDDTARATVRLSWNVPGIGAWSYRTRVALERRDEHWKVIWTPSVVPPA